jgi:hypothetical protein
MFQWKLYYKEDAELMMDLIKTKEWVDDTKWWHKTVMAEVRLQIQKNALSFNDYLNKLES